MADFEVFVMNPDGSGRTTLTAENPITDYNPLWTPDGTKILCVTAISGGAGNDTMFGGIGNDSLVGSAGADFSSAGPGADRISAEAGERIDVGAGPGDLCVIGGAVGCPARLS